MRLSPRGSLARCARFGKCSQQADNTQETYRYYDETHGTRRLYARLHLTVFKYPVKLLQLGILVESLRDDCVDPCVHECTQLNHAQ